ncbi:MAG: pyrroline-5-carboxylate reductase [Anaerolineae bacterium]
MLGEKKIGFIGSGNMAEPMMAGLIKEGVDAALITAADIRRERTLELQEKYGVQPAVDNGTIAAEADILILAVKPQYFDSIVPDIQGKIKASSLVISIMAGTTLETLSAGTGHPAVVRSMPNTPAQIGQGMTMWTATDAVSAEQKDQAQAVLSSFGRAVFANGEHYLDMSTAINGSGPGYVFLMLEAMVDTGVQLGLARPVAKELVLQTVIGAATYAQQSDLHLAQLRNNVTSPGGTTAAGLAALEEGGMRAILSDCIWAAYEKSVELGSK